MKTYLDCIPCFLRQTLNTCRLINTDDKTRERVLREVPTELAKIDLSPPPPVMGGYIHRIIRKLTSLSDPFADVKQDSNTLVLDMAEELDTMIESSKDRFDTAMRIAIAGNIIDYGTPHHLTPEIIREVIRKSLDTPITGEPQELLGAVEKANSILYIADNAGEIVTDRLFIEHLPTEKITLAVRGYPILNDVTYQDAETAGLTKIVNVIDNGADFPGTVLEKCSEEFLECFNSSDLIIAKGQGNYETLSEVPKDIFFLLKVKCHVLAHDLDTPVGSMVVRRSQPLPSIP